MKTASVDHERYHAFDALRASMMLLGVALHSIVAYSTLPDVWWLKDRQTSRLMDTLLLYIHAFRLPAFFVMSGFFAAMLHAKRGWQGMVENRTARLGLPFLLGMLAMFPFLKLASVWAWFDARRPDPWAATLEWIRQGKFERSIEPMHLWFLEVLMWVILLALPLARRLDGLERGWFRRILGSAWAPYFWALTTIPALVAMGYGILDTPKSFAPQLQVIAAYFVFFVFGWGLYRNRPELDRLKRFGWREIAAGAALMPAVIWALTREMPVGKFGDWPALLAAASASSFMCWLTIFGLIGLFLRHASKSSARMRYLSDSAYWLYLFHPPVLVVFQLPMMRIEWPAEVKALLGLAAAFPALIWTYDRWVRATWLGVVLNGRRYERGLPEERSVILVSCPALSESTPS